MKKPILRYNNPLWAVLGALVFLLIFAWSMSPLYVLYGTDSPFFQIIGLGMTQGKIPYVDLFDHKGPLIFFVDALGYTLGMGKTGLWLMQIVSLSVTLMILYKVARLFTSSDRNAFIAVALTLIPFVDFICEGNQCEEWMLPYESAALYLVCTYILSGSGRFEAWKSLVMGVIFSLLFYVRPNDGVMWIGGMYFGLFLLWVVRRQYRQILPNVGAFLGGVVLVSAPIFAYFMAHDAVDDMIYCMILHNMQYTGEAMFTWGGIGMIIIPVIMIISTLTMAGKDGHKDFNYVLIPVLVLVLLFIGKRDYYHYLIPLIPFVALCFAQALEHGWKKFLWVVCVLFAVFSFRQFKVIVTGLANRERYTTFYEQTDKLFEAVPEDQRNNIWNYNLADYHESDTGPHLASLAGAYLHAGMTPANAAFEPFQMVFRFSEENGYGIRQCEPEWVLMQPQAEFLKDVDYIEEHYELVAATPSEPVCEVRLYRRK